MNEYQEFGKKLREQNPKISVQEIAKKWQEHKESKAVEKEEEQFKDEDAADIPQAFKDEETQIKTTTRNFTDVIKEKLDQIKDMATLEHLLPSNVRMKHRLESLKKLTSAKSYRVRKNWTTIPPKMHATSPEGRKINNDEYEITFGVFHIDEKGNKKEFKIFNQETGTHLSSEYRIAYEVKEIIKTGKPITREVIRFNRG
jgi:hypothetical protein